MEKDDILQEAFEENFITITRKEYDYLFHRSKKLDYLESYGVDNWQGYSDAMHALYEDEN